MRAEPAIQVSAANAGERLDRLPICGFHWRILGLIGAGMFLDAFDIYLAGGVLGAVLKEGWSTLEMNAWFVSATFVGMTIGAWLSGILGDRFGRRFSYQFNLAIFGVASLAAAVAPTMAALIAARFVIGIGDRSGLCDAHRIRSRLLARPMDWTTGRDHELVPVCIFDGRLMGHSDIRLALHVRHCRRLGDDRLGGPQVDAGISSLAGFARPR